jgi:peptide methionine sulfoxide reductase MsrB
MKKLSSRTLLAAINCFILTASFLAVADVRVFLNKRMKLAEFTKKDNSLRMAGVEALCGRCNSPHGHLFDDGPARQLAKDTL